MIGAIAGAGLQAAGSIFGGIQAARAARKAKQNIENQKKENQAWYDRRYNEDATQRADAQYALNRLDESIRVRNKAAAGTAAVMGSGQEAAAMAKEANNAALSDATARVAAAGDARKDAIEEQYINKKNDLDNKLAGIESNRAGAITEAISGVSKAASDTAGLDFDSFKKKEKKEGEV